MHAFGNCTNAVQIYRNFLRMLEIMHTTQLIDKVLQYVEFGLTEVIFFGSTPMLQNGIKEIVDRAVFQV